jgi:hypothetical protein
MGDVGQSAAEATADLEASDQADVALGVRIARLAVAEGLAAAAGLVTNSASGYVGVRHTVRDRYEAVTTWRIDGRPHPTVLGVFDNGAEAALAYDRARCEREAASRAAGVRVRRRSSVYRKMGDVGQSAAEATSLAEAEGLELERSPGTSSGFYWVCARSDRRFEGRHYGQHGVHYLGVYSSAEQAALAVARAKRWCSTCAEASVSDGAAKGLLLGRRL